MNTKVWWPGWLDAKMWPNTRPGIQSFEVPMVADSLLVLKPHAANDLSRERNTVFLEKPDWLYRDSYSFALTYGEKGRLDCFKRLNFGAVPIMGWNEITGKYKGGE